MSGLLCSEARQTLMRTAARRTLPTVSTPALSIQTRLRWINFSSQSIARGKLHSITSYKPQQKRLLVPHGGAIRTLFSHKILRDYEELPREYKDQVGLQFRSKDLEEAATDLLFHKQLTAPAANHLLRVLHGRRVAGTLDDPQYAIHTAQFTHKQRATALAYLRKTVPIEEIRNAGLRAEDELEQIEKDSIKAAEKSKTGETGAAQDQAEAFKIDPLYGASSFDQIRARNQAKQKAREDALEEERKAKLAEEEAAQAGPLATREEYARSIRNPKIVKYYEEAQSEITEPPQMSRLQRIAPSAALVALAVSLLAGIALVYEEPAAKYRLFPDIPTSWATVATLIAANAVVYIGWRIPPLWKLFNKHMLVVVATIRPTTMFTAMFSHQRISHLFINMVPLWFVGTNLHDEIGRANFLALYLSCGAMGFLGSLVTYTLRGWLNVTALGASGATLGLCSAYFWEHRMDGFKILGLPQDGVHGIVFLALIFALQLTAFGRTAKLKVDVASHLSGMAAGIAGMELISRSDAMIGKRKDGKNIIEVKLDVPLKTEADEKEESAKWWKFW
ncbi:hypothetical protein VHEMI06337 [[Torrubiella] hemipterigena]|uniref:Peptidase S54 rhomboid domain-containing protein n=1 Tax=[Torrubiella] hemipterigena TaxID=1531966 RepID=A0A0A1T0A7_9HYPO|nr:hypothetical protein VHEMI06337 [[Torrubiella] hemipterigena]